MSRNNSNSRRHERTFPAGTLLRIVEPKDEIVTYYRNSPPIIDVPIYDCAWPIGSPANEAPIGFWRRPALAIVTNGVNTGQRVPVMVGNLSGWVSAQLVEPAEDH